MFKLIKPAPLSVRIHSRECFNYFNKLFMFIGLVQPKEPRKRFLYLCWSCFIFVFSPIFIPIGLILSLIKNREHFTPGEFLTVLQLCPNLTGGSVKILLLVMYLKRVNEMPLILDVLDRMLKCGRDREKIHRAVARSNYLFLIYAIFYYFCTLSGFMAGVLSGVPPWLLFNPIFDWHNGAGYFWLQSILELIIMLMMTSFVVILDTLPVLFMSIIRAHIDVLKEHICELRTKAQNTEVDNYEDLVSCIMYHRSILKCCELMRPILSDIVYVQFLVIGMVLGITMINVFYFSDLYRVISSLIYLNAVLLETFPFCYMCDLLVDDCAQLAILLGQSNWIDAERKYKSTLAIFMLHLQKPIIFLAGGIMPISLNSNIKVAKFAFSVMTIVQQMNLADRFK